jgi:hypothetical protein
LVNEIKCKKASVIFKALPVTQALSNRRNDECGIYSWTQTIQNSKVGKTKCRLRAVDISKREMSLIKSLSVLKSNNEIRNKKEHSNLGMIDTETKTQTFLKSFLS